MNDGNRNLSIVENAVFSILPVMAVSFWADGLRYAHEVSFS